MRGRSRFPIDPTRCELRYRAGVAASAVLWSGSVINDAIYE
jgi:hypothetical protein